MSLSEAFVGGVLDSRCGLRYKTVRVHRRTDLLADTAVTTPK
jgi:hypothetical protein